MTEQEKPVEAMTDEELEVATTPEPTTEDDIVDPDQVEPAQAPAEPVQPAEAEQVVNTKPTRQGNTNPADFDIFDEGGTYIEKRDR